MPLPSVSRSTMRPSGPTSSTSNWAARVPHRARSREIQTSRCVSGMSKSGVIGGGGRGGGKGGDGGGGGRGGGGGGGGGNGAGQGT